MKKYGISMGSILRFPLVWGALLLLCKWLYAYLLRTGVPLFAALITLTISVIFMYSMSRLLILFERKTRLYEGRKSDKEKYRFLFYRPKSYVAFVLFALLPLPIDAFWAFLPAGTSLFLFYLLSRAILPFYFIAFLLGGRAGLTHREVRPKERRLPILFLLHTAKYVALYTVGGIALTALAILSISLPGIALLIVTSSLGGAIVGIFGGLWVIRILRAFFKRRKFLKQLSEACEERGIAMPHIEKPFRSLFRSSGTLFTLALDGEVYTCRLISTFRPFLMHRFYSDGICARVHKLNTRILASRAGMGTTLLRQEIELWETRFDYAFEAEKGVRKILLFNPCSKIIEASDEGRSFPLDNGLNVGGYKFYTASAFCNAIARDCFDK